MTPEEVELLRELTIVIPTCNRPLELERAIEYWRDTPITVHIVDGSEKPWFPLGVLPGLPNITYHSLSPLIEEGRFENYTRRMQFASLIPVTKFSALCADDDFFTVSGLVKFCEQMNNDQNLDAVVGICSEFKLSGASSETRWHLRYADWKTGNHSRSDDVPRRVLDKSGAFYLCYAVMRTEPWKKTVSSSFQIIYDHDYFFEPLINNFGNAFCKSSVERHIYWIKTGWAPNPNLPGEGKRIRYADFFRDNENKYEVKLFERQLKNGFATVIPGPNGGKISENLAKKIRQRISKKSETRKYRKIKGDVLKFFVRIFDFLPSYIKLFVNQFLPNKLLVTTGAKSGDIFKNLTKNNYSLLPDFLFGLADTNITFDSKDFDAISKLLLKPREELRLHANL